MLILMLAILCANLRSPFTENISLPKLTLMDHEFSPNIFIFVMMYFIHINPT